MADTSDGGVRSWKLRFRISLVLVIIMLLCPAAQAAKYALLIGVADYQHLPSEGAPGQSDLKGPLNDVRIMFEALTDRYGFPANHIDMLVDRQATHDSIIERVKQRLVNGSRPGDLVVFYFAGHGSQVPDNNGDENDGTDEVLCPYDLVPQGGRNLILDDELGYWLRKLHDRKVVVILDCCHSGGAMRGSDSRYIPIEGYPSAPLKPHRMRGIANAEPDIPQGVIAMTSAREGQLAKELKKGRGNYHGGFTIGLVDAMRQTDIYSYGGLFRHARMVVRKRLKLNQSPQLLTSSELTDEMAFNAEVKSPEPIDIHQIKVRVQLEGVMLDAHGRNEMEQLRKFLEKSGILTIVDALSPFDCRIVGNKNRGAYHFRIFDWQGNRRNLQPTTTLAMAAHQIILQLDADYLLKRLSHISQPKPSFNVSLQVGGRSSRIFKLGEKPVFKIRSELDAYILLLSVDASNRVTLMHPLDTKSQIEAKAGTPLHLPDRSRPGGTADFTINATGRDVIKVIASTKKINVFGNRRRQPDRLPVSIRSKIGSGHADQVIHSMLSGATPWAGDAVMIMTEK